MNWGYVWNRTQNDADSQVKDKVGVVPLRASRPARRHLHRRLAGRRLRLLEERRAEAVKLVSLPHPRRKWRRCRRSRPRTSPYSRRSTPILRVLKANPWFKDALPVVQNRPRAAGVAIQSAGVGNHPHQHERLPRRLEDRRRRAGGHDAGSGPSDPVRPAAMSPLEAPVAGAGLHHAGPAVILLVVTVQYPIGGACPRLLRTECADGPWMARPWIGFEN